MQAADERPDATVEDIKAKYAQMGMIRIEFSRHKTLSIEREYHERTTPDESIPEKALKGRALELGIGYDVP